jgi:pSer/pThr/pTyr-binding forkhead associated (FHA) protein
MKIIKIGKELDNNIIIKNDPSVSRYHIQLFIDNDDNIFISDCNSTNGTYVNGQKINDPIKLDTYDVLKIGNTIINWKQLLLENEDLEEAFETFQDNLSILEQNPIKQKNIKKYKWLLIIISALISIIIICLFKIKI